MVDGVAVDSSLSQLHFECMNPALKMCFAIIAK